MLEAAAEIDCDVGDGDETALEAWGGSECTINRVDRRYRDQFVETGHLDRSDDFALLATLGLDAWRVPVLWERVSPKPVDPPDWRWSDGVMEFLSGAACARSSD